MIPFNIKTEIEKAINLCQNIFIQMTLFPKINKKDQAKNFPQKYFHSCNTFHNNKQKGTTNKFLPEIF